MSGMVDPWIVARLIAYGRMIASLDLVGEIDVRDETGASVRVSIERRQETDDLALGGYRIDVQADGYTGLELMEMGPHVDECERLLAHLVLP